jgi:AcrR family transcriptional regulator
MRRRLLDTALQLLRHGPDALSTRAVADAAHVSIGTVYRYFNDREDILDELLDAAVRDVYNDLASAVGTALGLDLDAGMRHIVEQLTTTFERHAQVLRAFGDRGFDSDLSRGIEQTLFALARVIPARHRPDLSPAQLDDLVFVSMGFTATGCLRIALQRPRDSDRDAMIDVTARMLAAALAPAR